MEPVYYTLPEDHDRHLRAVWKWLAIFFGGLAVLVALFVVNAHRIVMHLPFAVEQRFVRPYEALSERFVDEPDAESRSVLVYLQALADRIAGEMGLPPEFELKLHYLSGDEINAFATLGGHVFVFRGLIETMPDENSLAMVLAHEIAHVKNRDPIVSLGRGVALQMLYGFVTGSYGSGDLAAYGGNLGLLHFSRAQERAADELAVAALASAYGHTAGRATIFLKMLEDEASVDDSGRVPAWMSTHPELGERIREIDAISVRGGWEDGDVTPIPEHVRAAVAGGKSNSK